MTKLRFLRLAFASLLLIASMIFVIWSFWPATVQAESVPFPPYHHISLVVPERIHTGGKENVHLAIQPDANRAMTDNISEVHAMVEVRLELAGVEIIPGPTMTQPLTPETSMSFDWKITAGMSARYEGTLWVFVEQALPTGGEVERQAVLAYPLHITAVRLFGLPENKVRLLGVIGLGICLLLFLFPRLLKNRYGFGSSKKVRN